jgi:hypothetical protein
MKPDFDIYVTDPRKLHQAKIHLTRLLEIVEFALSKYEGNRNGHGTPDLGLPDFGGFKHDTKKPDIAGIIAALPEKFTTTSVILALGSEGKDNRARAKMVLGQWVKRGKLRISKAGQGRRPTEFEKVVNGN